MDWGTHSSKWWYTVQLNGGRHAGPPELPRVIDSTIYRSGDDLLVGHERARITRDVADTRLKRLLLKDPQGASYWEAVREGIGVSLGEAAVLTIGCMLGDVAKYLREQDLDVASAMQIHLRFSLPNWIGEDAEHSVARKRMYQTTVVCAGLVKMLGWDELPAVGKKVGISEWRDICSQVRRRPEIANLLAKLPTSFADMAEAEHSVQGIDWRLAAESSAAGYLTLLQQLHAVPRNAKAQKHWVKLLVVDVGAGSTDTGYLVSSRRIDNGELLMNYLPPARTLDYAGEQLTEMLRDFYFREHNRELSVDEAETMKLTAPSKWNGQQFIKDWRERIAKSVADYVFHVPDEARLGEPAIDGLKIVLTGGSGLVPGLGDALRAAVVDALGRRGIPGSVASRTEVVVLQHKNISDPIDAARRAVSTGAGQSDFALLAYRESFEKSLRTVVAAKGWV
jgi:hypothetical protein